MSNGRSTSSAAARPGARERRRGGRGGDPDDPDLFGLWESHEYLPTKISIYRRPLLESFPDPAELEAEIRITVLHELAHEFGLDEDRLDELGYT